MLAQGQSFSAKRGGLATDVSSGLIFLTKKKKYMKWLPGKNKYWGDIFTHMFVKIWNISERMHKKLGEKKLKVSIKKSHLGPARWRGG